MPEPNFPSLPVWQEVDIAKSYNARQELVQITRWSTDPERHPQRTPRYIHAARTTWRYGCTIVAGAFLGILISRLIPLCVGSCQPLEDLRMVVACGIGAAIALGYCNDVPKWYVRAVKFMGGAEE